MTRHRRYGRVGQCTASVGAVLSGVPCATGMFLFYLRWT
jgi:hypothetical protein